MRERLKDYYLKTYGKMDEIVHLVNAPAKVELLNNFIELTAVDADEVEKVTVSIAERELFLRRQMNYKPIEFNEVFSKELSLLLTSGIAGIGKTWLLKKCLLDWANNLVLQKADFILQLECRKLNQYQNCLCFLSEMRTLLKKHYQEHYGKTGPLVHNVKNPSRVEFLNCFVGVTTVDAGEVEKDYVNIDERDLFLEKKISYEPIMFQDVFSKNSPLLLVSGIAGIGKTWLLRKCLLDWANNLVWQKVDFVLQLECRKLNQYQNIGTLKELLDNYYEGIFKDCNILECFSILFVVDGLDEFAYLDELINHDPLNPSKHPIVNALAKALDFKKYKCVVAGRVGAILQYKEKVAECTDQLTIQIMGFNDDAINDYIKKSKISYDKADALKRVFESSVIAKSMASVPFYLSAMCAVIDSSTPSDSYSFCSMTELYCCTFLYFLQKHINKNNEPIFEMMQNDKNKKCILKVCEIAWHFFNQGKFVFCHNEIINLIDGFDEKVYLGFIEKVDSQLGYQYQFVHLTLMEFCASVHAHIYLSSKEIIENKRLRSCLPMICGLKNENNRSFLKYFTTLKNLKEEEELLLNLNSKLFKY